MDEGCVEQITFPSAESGRNNKYHIALVSIPGQDLYEVGLKVLFHKLGVTELNSHLIKSLMECRPETIYFHGCDITYPLTIHDIEITHESAVEWANNLKNKNHNS